MKLNKVLLESSSICQLKCPVCPQATGGIKNGFIGWGHLSFKNFKKFIDENDINHIELSGLGEPFLNPDLGKIFEYAQGKVFLTFNNGANFNDVSVLEELVKYQVRLITISIDGITEEVYQEYRRGGSLKKVLENVRKINEYKKKYNSEYPILKWQFVLFGHNEHQLKDAEVMAKSLNMEFCKKLNWSKTYSPATETREMYENKYHKKYLNSYNQVINSPMILHDGRLIGHCGNRKKSYGNVFIDGFDKCYNSKEYQKLLKKAYDKCIL